MMKSTLHTAHLKGYIAFIEGITGITVPETDYRNLGEAVKDGAAALGLTPDAYLDRLARDGGEQERFLNRITIGETYFFREERHFRALKDRVFPELRDRAEKVTIWSATCATGEEALSLAAFASAHLKIPFSVYATDLNSDSLAALKKGLYTKNSFREDGGSFRDVIMRFAAPDDRYVTIGRELLEKVTPLRINLFSGPLDALPDAVDIIFFRNTLIYMKPDVKMRVVERLAGRLAPGGYLFLASSEMPLIMNPMLSLREADGVYYFVHAPREDAAPAPAARDAGALPAVGPACEPRVETPRSAPAPPPPLDGRGILDAAGRTGVLDDRDPVQFMALLVLYALHFINRADTQSARDVIGVMEKHHADEVTWHLRGLAELTGGNANGAATCFRKALEANARFWPSRFYLASVMKESDEKRALAEFESCRAELAATPRRDAASYRLLLEGFSEKYFLEICESMARTLGKRNRDGK